MEIKIAFGTDNNYVQHMGCCIASILANSKPGENLHFYILDGGVSDENKRRVECLKKIAPCEIEWKSPDLSQLEGCPEIAQLLKSAYLRLLLPEVLPEIDKILYLDCDIIVTTSLMELWNLDFHDHSLCAVQDICEYIHNDNVLKYTQRLNLKQYFNSGVMLLNLKRLRENNQFRHALLWAKENKELVCCADQDALNVVFKDDCHYLPFRWNCQIMPKFWKDFLPDVMDEEIKQLLLHPMGIIHFIAEKPWFYFYHNRAGRLYWKYLRLTEWRKYHPERPAFKIRVKHFKNTNPYYQIYRKFRRQIKGYFFPEKKKP